MAPSIYSGSFLKNNMEFLEKRAKAMKSIPPDYFKGQISLYDTFENDLNMTEELSEIKCPALVVCGHVTIFEKPDVLNSLLLGFVIKNC